MPDSALHINASDPWDGIAPVHIAELKDSSISADVAAIANIYTATCVDDLPAAVHWIYEHHGEDVFPALVHPLRHPDGIETFQVKPVPGSVVGRDGKTLKYVGPSRKAGVPPQIFMRREVKHGGTALIVEGIKQSLAALTHAPEDCGIYGIPGINSWLDRDDDDSPSHPTPLLMALNGADVVIFPDADAGANPSVYDGALGLGEASLAYGATRVRYARLPGSGKDGLDDVLARLGSDADRTRLIRTLINQAKSKPADLSDTQLKSLRAQKASLRAESAMGAGRVPVDITADPRDVVQTIIDAVKAQPGRLRIYQRGGSLVCVDRAPSADAGEDRLETEVLDRSSLRRELLEVVYPYAPTKNGSRPDIIQDRLIDLVISRASEFPRLLMIVRAPLLRPDGSILTEPGYDESSGVLIDPSEDIRGLEVPLHPTSTEVAEAVSLLRDHLFARDGEGGFDGFAFKDAADQANAVAALLTLVLRPTLSTAPAILITGSMPGIGKGLVADCMHGVVYGHAAPIQTASRSDEEMEKRILSEFVSAEPAMYLDEAKTDEGSLVRSAPLQALITSKIYRGRLLGSNKSVVAPNRMCVVLLGNNIEVSPDMGRRVMPIRLESDRDDIDTRDNFRYDLGTWVGDNRKDLLRAALVLIRSWYDRGKPEAPRDFGLASFNQWQRVVGGILHNAGITDFLGNLAEMRKKLDPESAFNAEHLTWLEQHFPAGTRFAAKDVCVLLRATPDAPLPFSLSRSEAGEARSVSRAYTGHPRWYDGLRIRQDGTMQGKRIAFVIERRVTSTAPKSSGAIGPLTDPAADPMANASVPGALLSPPAPDTISFTNGGIAYQVARVAPQIGGPTIADLTGDAA